MNTSSLKLKNIFEQSGLDINVIKGHLEKSMVELSEAKTEKEALEQGVLKSQLTTLILLIS